MGLSGQTHIIRRQTLELQLTDGADAHQLQERVAQILSTQVTPILEAVMNDRVTESELLRIDQLEIDLGIVEWQRLDEQLPQRIREGFEKALDEQLIQAQHGEVLPLSWVAQSSGEPLAQPQRFSPLQAKLQLLIHYLRYGVLPWWYSNAAEFDLGELLAFQLSSQPQRLVQYLKAIPTNLAVKRLSRQLSSQHFVQLMLQLMIEEANATKQIVEVVIALIEENKTLLSSNRLSLRERLLHGVMQSQQPLNGWLEQRLVQWTEESLLEAKPLYHALSQLEMSELWLVSVVLPQLQRQIEVKVGEAGKPFESDKVIRQKSGQGALQSEGAYKEQSFTSQSSTQLREPVEGVGMGKDSGEREASDSIAAMENTHFESESAELSRDHLNSPQRPAADSSLPADSIAAESSSLTDGERTAMQTNAREASTSLVDVDAVSYTDKIPRDELPDLEHGVYLNNGGLVLLWSYLPLFFKSLGIVENNRFVDEAAKEKAPLLLQYLLNGDTHFQEHELLLNKLLCGYPLAEPIHCQLDLDDKIVAEADDLLGSVIANWQVLKNTSRDGLRRAFLIREGRLSQDEMGWLLKVNRLGMDVLLDSLPWGIGLIRLPWMEATLRVEW